MTYAVNQNEAILRYAALADQDRMAGHARARPIDSLAVHESMSQTDVPLPQRLPQAAFAIIAVCMIAVGAFRSLNEPLWSDELLTTNLLQAGSLTKLWSGIALGIDGNPPLYLTAVWLIIQAVPKAFPLVPFLKLISLGLTIATICLLFRLGRRFASLTACGVGCILLAMLNDNVAFVASELRTYALYFFMAALAVLLQLRLIEHGRVRDAVLLALAYVGLTLVHTFGIAYVGCIALAGWLSQLRGERSYSQLIVTIGPAIIALTGWSPFLLQQLEVAKPYGWMERPGLPELLEVLFASKAAMCVAILELVCIAAVLLPVVKDCRFPFCSVIDDPKWRRLRYVTLLLGGITGLTLAGWIISIVWFPLFVPRFFTPQIIVAFALHVAFGESLLRLWHGRRIIVVAACALAGPLAIFNVAKNSENSGYRWPICGDDKGSYFEAPFVRGDLPVVTESPHVFLPRATYADHRLAYLFPLDWEVVLKYPERARGNAVDFHIMQNLKTWKPMPAVVSTADIIQNFRQFFVIEQPGRAWFKNLIANHAVITEKLAITDSHQLSCTLWKVTNLNARP
jgi:hypothetical protein